LALLAACYAGTLDKRRLRGLVDEQLQRFEDALGTVPDYLDGHRHVHQLPRVRDTVLAALYARYGARLPWIRVSIAGGVRPGAKARLVSLLGGKEMAARCRALGFACNQRLLGFYDFAHVQADHRPRLGAWLAQAQSGDVLMCHPAARAEADDPIGVARHAEFTAMQSAWWPEALAAQGIGLRRGGAHGGAGQAA
jgi:chitin disaccharide deacetylase